VRQSIQTLGAYVGPAFLAGAKLVGRLVEPPKSLVDVVEQPPFLAGKQEGLLTFHRVGSLIGHVEAVSRQIAVRALK